MTGSESLRDQEPMTDDELEQAREEISEVFDEVREDLSPDLGGGE